jgi:hypothetical protein
MLNKAIRRRRACLLAGCALVLFATRASAQVVAGGQPLNGQQAINGGPIMLPGLNGMMPGGSQLSQQQLQNLMLMRAMQMRGRHPVRTGFPQDIPLGNPGSLGGATATPAAADTKTASRKSTSQKKSEARAAREEKKRAAKEEAKAKKAKASKPADDAKNDDAAASP